MEYGSVGQVNFGFLEAGTVIAMIPCVLLFVGLQRFYIRGVVSGVVKGRRAVSGPRLGKVVISA